MNRSTSADPQLVLVFYNFKGVGQIIRLLLCYLEIPFADIFVEQYQTQRQILPQKIRKMYQQNPVNKAQLPAIIHDGEVIYELNQITTYICRAFEKQDLLGINLQQKTQVCQIMEIISQKIMKSIMSLRNYVMAAFNSPLQGIQLLSFIQTHYQQFLQKSGHIMELTAYLMKQEYPKFVYGNITVADFYYIEGARHTISLYGAIDEQVASARWTELAQKYLVYKNQKHEVIKRVEILRAIKQYLTFITSQQFYKQNQEYIESFKVLPKSVPETILIGMKKIWAIDQKYLHYYI